MTEPLSSALIPSAYSSIAGPVILIHREDRFSGAARRIFDVIFASALLIGSLPIVAFAAAAIVAEDGFPVFFVQRRIGLYGRSFGIFKLRTMKRTCCGSESKPATSRDPRITRVGRVLRMASIDELPQLINVLRGEMSVIGPRPEMPFVVARYERWQHLRHLMRPGLAGIWQAKHRSVPLSHPSATLLDIAYIRSASPVLDAALLCQTVVAIVRRKGAV